MQIRMPWELAQEDPLYVDQGCEVFPSCLNCPLPRCLEEEPWAKHRFLKGMRAQRMLELRGEGKSLLEIAGMFDVSTRTVLRALKAARVDGRADQESEGEEIRDRCRVTAKA
jgi:hypothetical protein